MCIRDRYSRSRLSRHSTEHKYGYTCPAMQRLVFEGGGRRVRLSANICQLHRPNTIPIFCAAVCRDYRLRTYIGIALKFLFVFDIENHIHSSLVAAALILIIQPLIHDHLGHLHAYDTGTEGEDVGIVMLTGPVSYTHLVQSGLHH